ncbi:MAG TPA: DUF4245 domain-containing protein [Pseudonocardiaceae bacterium]
MADNASDEPTDGPAPPARTGRGRFGMRDMVLSMVVLAVGVLILAGISTGFSFSPGGVSVNTSNLPTVDVSAELRAAVSQVPFPVREPRLPADWRPNSDSVDSLGPAKAIRVGLITAGGRYLQLSQSNATPLALVRVAAGLADDVSVPATGTETANSTKWTVYPGVRSEQSWVADLGSVRLFITGNGTTAEFRTLAVAALTGRPVHAAGS